MPGWDRLVSGLWSVSQFVALPLIAALDVRFGWTRDFNAVIQLLGALVFAGGLGLFSWAMIVNAYFSTAARIQSGQTVCPSGPYRFVRHPGYAGAILQSFGIALLLGSWWALIPAAAAVVFMVIRTVLEDRMLQAELDGYAEYVHEVRFRLIPRCW
jgi:protein-S-isoprenylcysteine O-methyltransferase Ste14